MTMRRWRGENRVPECAIPSIRRRLDTLAELDPAAVAVLADTRAAFADLAHLLQGHFAKEENVLFPALEEMAKADREGGHRPLN